MLKWNKLLFGVATLFALPEIYAYQCQIDLENNYSGHSTYINGKGDVYVTVDYAGGRYDSMEYVYDIKNCKKISDGVKKNSNIQSVLDRNGFRQIANENDLSPWLTHYYSANKQNDRLVFKVDELSNQEQQMMRELFAYAVDKGNSPSSSLGAIFNTKYAKTAQFKSLISRYFVSQNFARYATRIEQELLSSPESLKDGVDLHFLASRAYKIIGRNSRSNEFKITLEPAEKMKASKVPTIVMKANCRDISGLKNKRHRTVSSGVWIFEKNYRQEVADKAVTCTLNGQKSDDSLKANLSTAANVLGLKRDVSFDNYQLGTYDELVVLSEEYLPPPPPSPEEQARRQARSDEYDRCKNKQYTCESACPSISLFSSEQENEAARSCRRQCKMIHACSY